jgi:hypothetical protein
MSEIETGDLTISFIPNFAGYSMFRIEDMYDDDTAITSGVTIKMEPDLATRELDLESIIQIENKVRVTYGWNYSSYSAEKDYPNDLPFEWTTESEDGTIDQDDSLTWPSVGRIEWYENGELVKVRHWEYGNTDWDK